MRCVKASRYFAVSVDLHVEYPPPSVVVNCFCTSTVENRWVGDRTSQNLPQSPIGFENCSYVVFSTANEQRGV